MGAAPDCSSASAGKPSALVIAKQSAIQYAINKGYAFAPFLPDPRSAA